MTGNHGAVTRSQQSNKWRQPGNGNNFPNWRSNNQQGPKHNSHHQTRSRQFGSQKSTQTNKNVFQDSQSCRERNTSGFGFKFIETLCQEDPENIITTISTNKSFSVRLDQELSGDYITIIIKLLSKMCTSAFKECQTDIIRTFCKDKFIMQLIPFISTLHLHDIKDKKHNSYFWGNPEEFWNNLCIMCNTVIELIPTKAIEIIPKLNAAASTSIQNIESIHHDVKFSDDTKEKFEKIKEKLDLCIKEIEKKITIVKCPDHDNFVEMEPPDNFRELSVYPTSVEVLSEERSFLRKNKIDRKYNSVDEYLDIQFRLLREDFVGPLREGIKEYKYEGKHNGKKNHTVKVHKKVQFIGTHNVKEQVGYKVQFEFDLKKLTKKFSKMENSKRFMFGALVCFTKDQFQTLIFGKIIDRDIQMLEKGMIVVNFDHDAVIEYGVDYIMVECNVYFEPYYHVLKALQAMDAENFPMARYIINVDPEIRPPGYLTNGCTYSIDDHRIEITNPLSWPNAEALHLNDSQYAAFKAGLTNEFCIIQGPPGNFLYF